MGVSRRSELNNNYSREWLEIAVGLSGSRAAAREQLATVISGSAESGPTDSRPRASLNFLARQD